MAEEHKLPAGKLPPEALKRSVLSIRISIPKSSSAPRRRGRFGHTLARRKISRLLVRPDSRRGQGRGPSARQNKFNDIASKGGDPAYLAVTLVLPPALGEEGARRIMSEIDEECRAQGIAVAGGHTEFNDRYDRPVIMGALIGTADKVMRATGHLRGRPACRHEAHRHRGHVDTRARPPRASRTLHDARRNCGNRIVGRRDFRSRRVARGAPLREFMHDPTEGGFLGGLDEISQLCGRRAELWRDALPVHPLTKRAAEHLGFDPLKLIASGSLLAVVPPRTRPRRRRLRSAPQASTPSSRGAWAGRSQKNFPSLRKSLWRLLKMGKE